MKGICFHSIGKVQWMELPDPIVESQSDAIVAVEIAGMCGSDLHPLFGREPGLDPGTVMGHEFVGKVIALGSEVRTLQIGDRVYSPFTTSCGVCFYCQKGITSRCPSGQAIGWRTDGKGLHGGQAELVRVPLADGTLVRIPPGLTAEAALLLGDNFSTGYFCAEMANIDPSGLTVILGCGSVGLLSIMAAKHLGARNLLALDPVESRREMAEKLGVRAMAPSDDALTAIRSMTQGRGADSVMELVGRSDAQKFAFEALRPGGTMAVIGCHSSPHFAFTPTDAYNKSITYRTGRCPARFYMGKLTERVASESWQIESVITHQFEPEDCSQAYDIFAGQKQGCVKGVFRF
jgi:2-desacetyl-2-hydroxyethyl bacteriochlorophyllide A dehydrogenase